MPVVCIKMYNNMYINGSLLSRHYIPLSCCVLVTLGSIGHASEIISISTPVGFFDADIKSQPLPEFSLMVALFPISQPQYLLRHLHKGRLQYGKFKNKLTSFSTSFISVDKIT